MPHGQNTTPERIIRSDGVATTVHKGRAAKSPVKSNSRIPSSTTPAIPAKKIEVGESFYSHYADSMVKFNITSVDKDVITAVSEDLDWDGVTKLFSRAEVESVYRYEDAISNLSNRNEAFWEGHAVGDTVHYHDGFGQFVRGEIVDVDGENQMRPTALIGKWRNISSRNSNGDPEYSHHAKGIIAGRTFRPSSTNMWEDMSEDSKNDPKYDFIREAGGDISAIEAIDFSLPEITTKEKADADVFKKSSAVYKSVGQGEPTLDDVAETRRLLDELEASIRVRDGL